jgi:hypothetical protein
MVITANYLYLLSKAKKILIFKPLSLKLIENFTVSTSYKFGCSFKLNDLQVIGFSHVLVELQKLADLIEFCKLMFKQLKLPSTIYFSDSV